MTSSGDGRRGFPKAVWGWIAAWVVVAVLAAVWGVSGEEDDLANRAGEVLAGTGLQVDFQGRDATISGSADQATIDAAADSVYDLRGVRRVDISQVAAVASTTTTTTQPPATTTTAAPDATATTESVEPAPPSLTTQFSAGNMVLRGAMPDQATIDAIAAAAIDEYGTDKVSNEMTVAEVARRDYLAVLPGLFGVGAGLDPWDSTLENDQLSFRGLGPDQDVVASSQNAFEMFVAGTSFGGTEVDIQIDPNAVASSLTELLAGGANFETGSANLSAEAMVKLDEVIAIMLANPATGLTVEGHTDNQGDAAANQALSEARAQAVVDYLIAGGVAADRLTAIGYGEEQPIADNDTAEGRAMNRRIEFVVSEGE